MSEQKWAVLGTEAMNGWLVAHPGDVLRLDDGRLECWAVHSRHHTWEEAMREAFRQARTITATLPANPDRVLPVTSIMVRHDLGGVWVERTYRVAWDWEITIPDKYRETVALALLAHIRGEAAGTGKV